MNITGYMHIATMGNWEEVVAEQLKFIKDSGLLEVACIYAGIVGEQYEIAESLLINNGIRTFSNPAIRLNEQYTLRALHKFCLEHPQNKVWYIHTKGVRHSEDYSHCKRTTSWRQYMQYFVLWRWRDCEKALDEYDVCGVEWKDTPQLHFSGNFWWANASYIATLDADYIKDGVPRLNSEFFIGTKNPKAKSFHESNLELNRIVYPMEKYVEAGQTLPIKSELSRLIPIF